MNVYIEYQTQLQIRSSDKSLTSITNSDYNSPLISSETWHEWSEKFEAGSKAFGVVAGLAALTGAEPIALAAGGTAAISTVASEIAKQQEASAKAKEKAVAERRALERAMKESAERGMREHQERMSRGEYRDPPTRERMAEIGRMA